MCAKRVMMIGLDGADPFVIKKLMDQGRLSNFKKVLENGVAHESLAMLGVYPTVTPPNWASLATGNWPRTHGVTCFHNHTLGKSLSVAETNWDSRRVESELIWETFSKNKKRSIMLNYCEAWPPRLADDPYAVYIDGTSVVPFIRNSADFQKVVTLKSEEIPVSFVPHFVDPAAGDCVVYGDQFEKMTTLQTKEQEKVDIRSKLPAQDFKVVVTSPKYPQKMRIDEADQIISPLKEPSNWAVELPKGARVAALPLNNGLLRRYAVLTASDGKHYDTVAIYASRKDGRFLGEARTGQWSDWIYDTYQVMDESVKVAYKIRVLSIEEDGSSAQFYISHAQNCQDASYVYPADLFQEILNDIGPMLCFAKYASTAEGDNVMHESFQQLYDWHIEVTDYLFKKYPDWQLFYTHLHAIDMYNHWFINRSLPGSHDHYEHYAELIYGMYEIMDKYIGAMLKYLDGNTTIFITSDHAAVPYFPGERNPGIGGITGIDTGVMEELGYTKTYLEEKTGLVKIDWSQTRAVAHRSSYIYINLKGREPEGIVEPEDYDKLVEEIIDALYGYRHPVSGRRIVAFCMTRDEMETVGMGGKHCGDIFYQLVPGYCNQHANSPSTTSNEGYSLNNLCMMIGAGLKAKTFIRRPIRVVDIVPTICYLTDTPMCSNVEGGVIYQALEGFEERID